MVAYNTISGSGSIAGSGSINSGVTFSRSLSLTMANFNDNSCGLIFTPNTMFALYYFPQYMTDYMPESTPLLITVSGLQGGDEAMNGHTFTIMRATQTIVDVDGSFTSFITTFNLDGHQASEKYDHVWNWNS